MAALLAALALAGCPPPPPAQPPVHEITSPRWVSNTLVTEYWPSPESWFHGRLVRAPGLPGRHPADWLFGSRGLAMEGEGITLGGRMVHFGALIADLIAESPADAPISRDTS